MSLSSYRATSISNDITKIVRAHYNPPEAKPYKFKKAWNRTSTNLLEERPETVWEKHYIRRQENLTKGYQSVPWEPYKSLGGQLIVDPYDLVMTTMADSLDEKAWTVPHKQFFDDKPERKRKVTPPLPILDKPVVASSSLKLAESEEKLKPIDTFKKVKDHLRNTSKLITKIRLGHSYEEYIRCQQEHPKQSDEDDSQDNGMQLMSLTDLQLGLVDLAGDSDSEDGECPEISVLPKESSKQKEQNIDHTLRRMSRIRKSLALQPEDVHLNIMSEVERRMSAIPQEETNPIIRKSSGVTEKKERLRRDHLLYLEALYKVIVSLHNMKARDLKSKVPLSHNAVKVLGKEYSPPNMYSGTERESRLNYLGGFQSRSRRISSTTVDSDGGIGGTHTSGLPPLSTPRKLDNVGPPPVTAPKLGFDRKRSMRAPLEAILMAIKDKTPAPQIETWEDLLALPDKKGRSSHQSNTSSGFTALSGGASIIVKAIQWHKKITGVKGGSSESCQQEEPPASAPQVTSQYSIENTRQPSCKKPLPIWQLVSQEKYPKAPSSKKKKAKDIYNLVQNDRRKFRKLQASLQQELEASYQKFEREQMLTFKFKYETFENLSQLYEIQKKKMKTAIENMTRKVDVFDVPPSKWYDELREKTFSVTGPNDVEINKMLGKLNKFSTMDSKTVIQSKRSFWGLTLYCVIIFTFNAKLCLLVMSLPAYEILTITMQKAIKPIIDKPPALYFSHQTSQYVLENILLGEVGMFTDWLQHRRLPLVIET